MSVDSFKGSPRAARWSAPVFLSLNGLSSGLTLGAQRADLLIGCGRCCRPGWLAG